MLKKIFKDSKPGKATFLIALTSLFSYGIGLFRDRIIAVNFGTSSATDVYNASFLIPDLLFNLFIAGALSAAFLPVFSDYLESDKKEAFKLANTMLTAATLLISILAITAFLLMPIIIPISFPEATEAMQNDIISMTRIMLLSAVLFAVSNTMGNILMSFKHFIAYSLSPILYNLGIIFGVLFLEPHFGIYSAALGVVIGAGLHCIVRVIDSLYTQYRYKPELKLRHPGFKKIIRLMLPRSISLIAWQINLYIFAVVGISMQEGGLAAFHFARNIQSFAVSLFGISFATAIFPFLANSASAKDKSKYTAHIQKTIQRILFFTLPSAAGLMTLSSETVDLILSGGIFDAQSVKITGLILFFFSLSIPFESLTHILARAFYAVKDTLTPMIINISAMSIMALTTIFIAPDYGIEWFSIGFTVGFAFYVTLATILIRKKLQDFDIKIFSLSLLKTIIATLLMTVIVLSLDQLENIVSLKLATVSRISIGAFIYFITAKLLKSPEIESVNYIISRILKKKVI